MKKLNIFKKLSISVVCMLLLMTVATIPISAASVSVQKKADLVVEVDRSKFYLKTTCYITFDSTTKKPTRIGNSSCQSATSSTGWYVSAKNVHQLIDGNHVSILWKYTAQKGSSTQTGTKLVEYYY